MIPAFIEIILLSFLPIALLLLILAYVNNSSKPLVAASLLFAAYTFDSLVRYLPIFFSFTDSQIGHYNWVGGLLSFLWPWPVIFLFKWLNAEEVGLKLERPVKGIFFGLIFGLVLGGWNILDGYFLTDLPSNNLIESMIFQLFVPAFSEELVFRGLFLAILDRYLEKRWVVTTFSFGWGIVLVSILFIGVHLISFDRTTGQLMWTGALDVLGNIIVSTVALAYLRLKTGSLWPGVICHSLINSMPFFAAYFLFGKT